MPFNQFLQTGKTTLWHIIKTDTETCHRPCPHLPCFTRTHLSLRMYHSRHFYYQICVSATTRAQKCSPPQGSLPSATSLCCYHFVILRKCCKWNHTGYSLPRRAIFPQHYQKWNGFIRTNPPQQLTQVQLYKPCSLAV